MVVKKFGKLQMKENMGYGEYIEKIVKGMKSF